MTNQLGKFSPNLANLTKPLRELLSKKFSWLWGPDQERAFHQVKEELTKPAILAHYDPLLETRISADASSFGLGAVLTQKNTSGQWRPVAYASRSMAKVERRYAQIEKEALATVCAIEKFQDSIVGKRITIETDHKPLVPLLNTKHKFSYQAEHVPGKLLCAADSLLRAPITTTQESRVLQLEAEQWIQAIVQSLPATQLRLQQYKEAQARDLVCLELIEFFRKGWPSKSQLKPYWEAQHMLTLSHDLLLYGPRIVVPLSLQKQTLEKLHQGHQGI